MTQADTPNKVQYNGNGVTSTFSTGTINFYDPTDLIVTTTVVATGVSTVLALTTNYTVAGGDPEVSAAGSVTLVAGALPVGTRITIERSIPYTQTDDYVEGENILARTIETGFDRALIRDQQLRDSVERSFSLPATSSYTGSLEIPEPAASTILGWNSAADGLENKTLASISTSLDTVFTDLAANDMIVFNGTQWENQPKGDLANLDTVSTSQIDDNAVTYAKMQNVSATSRLIGRVSSGSGDLEELNIFQALNMITGSTRGDVLYRGATNWARLGVGTNGQVLTSNGTDPAWADAPSPITNWTSYTPTFTGFGTVTVQEFWYKRVGDSLEIQGRFTCGTSTATEARLSLPSGFTSSATKITNIRLCGTWCYAATSGTQGTVLIESNTAYATFGLQSASFAGLTKQNGSAFTGSGSVVSLFLTIPID